LETTPDFVGIADHQGRTLYVNPAGRKMMGFGPDEDLSNIKIPDYHPRWAADLIMTQGIPATLREGAWTAETAFLSRDGLEIPTLQVLLAHKSSDGAVEVFSTIARDITERKHLEAQLRQSQKIEAVGRLAGGIAHDFNNLLTVINGYSDLLLGTEQLQDSLHDGLQQIRQAGQRASLLTSQLLAFSRRQVLQPQVLNLNAAVTNIAPMLRRLLGEHIELVTALAPGLGRVEVDPGQMDQVIMNLAINARDAMPEGGRLTVETANVGFDETDARKHAFIQPGPYVTLSVTDTGCGMDAGTRQRIFEPFFTTKPTGQGTGLGLSTVFGIVKQSGGSILVDSEPGRGARFTIYLPRVEEAVTEAQASPASASPPPGSETILLVEDEAMVRRLAQQVLLDRGYRVLVARDCREALVCSEEHNGLIDLLVTDAVMPEGSGTKVAERLALSRPGMKVLLMSGYTDDDMVRSGISEKGIPFLHKPFTPNELARKVREVLDMPPKIRT
jgi:PAS domain S-box-containing protein